MIKLTDKQELELAANTKKWLGYFNDGDLFNKSDEEITEKVLWLYNKSNLAAPKVVICDSPEACRQALVQVLKDTGEFAGKTTQQIEELQRFSIYGNSQDMGWVSYCDYYISQGLVEDSEVFQEYKKLILCGIFDSIQTNTHCFVCRFPVPGSVKLDDEYNVHSETGYALQFRDGYSTCYIHGRKIPNHWIFEPETITREEFFESDDAEHRRIMAEVIGDDKFASLFELQLLDEYTETAKEAVFRTDVPDDIPEDVVQDMEMKGILQDLYDTEIIGFKEVTRNYELYRSKETDPVIDDEYYYFLKVICPSSQRVYHIPVAPCETAREAERSTRPEEARSAVLISES